MPLDLSGLRGYTAAYAASALRDFRPLLAYLKEGGEIDEHVRAVLVEEVERLAKQPPKAPRPRKRLKGEAEHELRRLKAVFSGSDLGAGHDDVLYEAMEDLARRLGVHGDLTKKGNVTKAARAVLCHLWGINDAELERILYDSRRQAGKIPAKRDRKIEEIR